MSDWSLIEQYSDWCYYDRLNGEDLEDGELLAIYWPDRSVSSETIMVHEYSKPGNDMGAAIGIPCKDAYILISHNGVTGIRVPLIGLKARRRNK